MVDIHGNEMQHYNFSEGLQDELFRNKWYDTNIIHKSIGLFPTLYPSDIQIRHEATLTVHRLQALGGQILSLEYIRLLSLNSPRLHI